MDYSPQIENLKKARLGFGSITCISCGKETKLKSPVQKYCPSCSEIADLKRKKLWARKNPPSEALRYKNKIKIGLINKSCPKAGQIRNAEYGCEGVCWMEKPIDTDILYRFKIPFDQKLSKNALWSTTRSGHVYIRREVKLLKEQIAWMVKGAKIKWRVNKIYLDILVQKPSMRGDAVNMLDTIADGVKIGVGLDDNWFSVKRLDWEIVKENPQIIIGLSQKNEDVYYCSYCGIPQSFDNFTKSKNNRFGISSECKSCTKLARKLLK